MKLSLKTKIVFAICILIIISLTLSGAISYIYVSNSMQSTIEQNLSQKSSQAAENTIQTLDSAKKTVQMLSLNDNLAKLAAGDTTKSSDARNYLSSLMQINSGKIEMFAVTDSKGTELVNNEKTDVNIDLSSRQYVKDALSGTFSQSGVIVSLTTKNTVVAMAYPLKIDGKVVGSVIGSVLFDNISSTSANLKTGKKGYSYLVDKSGLIVYHPDSKKILNENITKIKNVQLSALFSKGKSNKAEGYYTSSSGSKEYAVLVPVDDWVLVVTADFNEYMSPVYAIRTISIILIIIFSVISALIAYFAIARRIVNPIKILEELMTKAGNGDLCVKANIKTKDEIQNLGEYFNKMIEHQNSIISNIRNHAEELTGSSEELSASSEEINAATEEIAANIQNVAKNAQDQNKLIVETSEVLVQLSSLVQIAQNKALTAKDNSGSTMEAAKNGRIKVKDTSDAINNISTSAVSTDKALKSLAEISKKVNGIINTINSISQQTDLLALNAAIEAARAGEHGRGFTVVAGEVRKLSEQTSIEAENISTLIKDMTDQIEKAVDSMNKSRVAVENGVIVANETDKSFIMIIDAVEQVVKDIERIVDVTNDEVASSDHIVKLIDSVATITEKTTSSSEQVAAAAEEEAATVQNITESAQQTSDMAISMNEIVEKFII